MLNKFLRNLLSEVYAGIYCQKTKKNPPAFSWGGFFRKVELRVIPISQSEPSRACRPG
jgi:hypothetical protein